jgi:pimeloyl-ACP methyl ester carboxylesterase
MTHFAAPLTRTIARVGGVASEVVTLTTARRSRGPAIVVFPGNPGLISYYEPFMASLSARFPSASVHGISHAGHSPHVPASARRLFTLDEQIDHKAAFVSQLQRERLATGARGPLVVVGHSVGAYMAMRVLATRPDVTIDKVVKIFPTLMDFPDCCGNVIPVLVRPVVREFVAILATLLGLLPHWLLTALVYFAQPKMRTGHPNALGMFFFFFFEPEFH